MAFSFCQPLARQRLICTPHLWCKSRWHWQVVVGEATARSHNVNRWPSPERRTQAARIHGGLTGRLKRSVYCLRTPVQPRGKDAVDRVPSLSHLDVRKKWQPSLPAFKRNTVMRCRLPDARDIMKNREVRAEASRDILCGKPRHQLRFAGRSQILKQSRPGLMTGPSWRINRYSALIRERLSRRSCGPSLKRFFASVRCSQDSAVSYLSGKP